MMSAESHCDMMSRADAVCCACRWSRGWSVCWRRSQTSFNTPHGTNVTRVWSDLKHMRGCNSTRE